MVGVGEATAAGLTTMYSYNVVIVRAIVPIAGNQKRKQKMAKNKIAFFSEICECDIDNYNDQQKFLYFIQVLIAIDLFNVQTFLNKS